MESDGHCLRTSQYHITRCGCFSCSARTSRHLHRCFHFADNSEDFYQRTIACSRTSKTLEWNCSCITWRTAVELRASDEINYRLAEADGVGSDAPVLVFLNALRRRACINTWAANPSYIQSNHHIQKLKEKTHQKKTPQQQVRGSYRIGAHQRWVSDIKLDIQSQTFSKRD